MTTAVFAIGRDAHENALETAISLIEVDPSITGEEWLRRTAETPFNKLLATAIDYVQRALDGKPVHKDTGTDLDKIDESEIPF